MYRRLKPFLRSAPLFLQANQHLSQQHSKPQKTRMSRSFSYNENSVVIANSFNNSVPDVESKILAWLSPLEPWVRHRDIGAQRIDSVGDWLLETEEFRRWYKGSREDGSSDATLFCYGNPGVGKSYIT